MDSCEEFMFVILSFPSDSVDGGLSSSVLISAAPGDRSEGGLKLVLPTKTMVSSTALAPGSEMKVILSYIMIQFTVFCTNVNEKCVQVVQVLIICVHGLWVGDGWVSKLSDLQ